MSVRRILAAFAVPVALAVVCASVFFCRSVRFKTSLYDIVGTSAETVPEAVREHSSCLVPIMVSSADAAAARAAADDLVRRLPVNECASIRYRFDGSAFSTLLELCREHRAGLVSPHDERLLETAEGRRKIARAALRRYYASPVPPLLSPEEDPFCLTDGFVKSLPVSYSGWTQLDGVLTASRDGVFYILIIVELKREMADDPDALIAFKERLDEIFAEARKPSVSINACGVPLHTAFTAGRCKTEINWLTLISTLFIVLLSTVVFRSFKWLPLLAGLLGAAALAGAAASLILFSTVHVMTFVFGTTVLGLVVDYSFHWLLQDGAECAKTRRNLIISFVTTEISLLPLLLSSLPVLRQSAVFLGTGLAAALAYVLVCYPRPSRCGHMFDPRPVRIPFAVPALAALILISVFGACRARFATDPAAIYRPSAELAESEKILAELSGLNDESRGFLVISGDGCLENLLERESSLGLSDAVPRLSGFLPAFERRMKNYENIVRLYAEHGDRQRENLGVGSLVTQPSPRPWQWNDVPAFASAFISGDNLLIPSAPAPEAELPEGVRFYHLKSILAGMLSELADETGVRLVISMAVMFLALLVLCRCRAIRVIFPSLAALLAVLGVLGFAEENVTLFHLLASFILLGTGVDYTVFLHNGGRAALKPAICSLLTSVVGFGALSFVSFPAVNAFGSVLAIGLPVAFFCALATVPDPEPATEHGASPIGLEVLFAVYRIFGLMVLHAFAGCFGFFMWLFSRDVRRASPSPRKVIAFTHSLADKLVVMANGSNMPVVETDGSSDARRFIDDVAAKRGVFVLSSHCGTVEVLSALGTCDVAFHAWMEFERTSVFNRFYLRHAKREKVTIHPISSFGPETVFTAGDLIDAGDCLVMAGDRGAGRKRKVRFGSGEIELSEGAFRFARALGHPVYFAACVSEGGRRYRAVIRRLPTENLDVMIKEYADVLYGVVSAYPHQWFKWERGR